MESSIWLARERMVDARQRADRERLARGARNQGKDRPLLRRVLGLR